MPDRLHLGDQFSGVRCGFTSASDRQHILRHLVRRKRHVILKPPSQEAENGSREKLHLHGKWNGGVLSGRGQCAHFGRNLFCNILLDQLLKPANPLPTQHQLVKLLMVCQLELLKISVV